MKESGKFKSGLGSTNKYTYENHPKPKKIGELKNMSEDNITKTLKDYEKQIKDDKIENAIVITTSGEIYQCFGNESNVWPDTDLGDKLKGAYVTHNHPKETTNFSFSSMDRGLFSKYELKIIRGIDYKYTYELNRNSSFKEKMPTVEEMESYLSGNDFHLENVMYSYQYDIGYKRWKND